MKRLFAILSLCTMVALSSRGQSADDQYVRIYGLIQEADSANDANHTREALAKYGEAQTNLLRFQRNFPGWNALVVDFRLSYLTNQMAAAKAKILPETDTAKPASGPQPPANEPAVVVSTELDTQLNALRTQVGMLEAEKQNLEAKLKEAFAAQPAAVDPRELAKAEENVRALQKENELLKVSLSQAQTNAIRQPAETKIVAQLKQQLTESNRKLEEASDRASKLTAARARDLEAAEGKVKALQSENDLLKTSLAQAQSASAKSGDTKAVEQLKQQLAESNRKLTEAAEKLATEHQPIPTPVVVPVSKSDADAAALRLENELLKNQLAQKQTASIPTGAPDEINRQLAEARAQIALLQSDTEILQLEKMALANRATQPSALPVNSAAVTAPPPKVNAPPQKAVTPKVAANAPEKPAVTPVAPAPPVVSPAPVVADAQAEQRAREQDELLRAELLKKLEETRKEQAARPEQEITSPSITEAPVTTSPSHAQNSPPAGPASQPATPAAVPEPSADNAVTAKLVADAQQFFATGQFDKAEENYLQVLKLDAKNVFVLGNLAAIEVELNHLDEAEKYIQRAITLAPNDAYSLSVLGNLRFKQEKYEDALVALNHAAQLRPENAEIQNYLGVTLSHLGRRAEAEAALRKAVQIDPKYAGAHNNLAVVYLTEQPPSVALARWHYQKALAAGAPHNPNLEKMLEANAPAVPKQ